MGVSFRDPQNGAACGINGTIVQTSDGGKSWFFAHQADKPDGPPNALVPRQLRLDLPAREPLFSIDLYGKDSGLTTGMAGTALRLRATERGVRLRDFHPYRFPSCRHGFSMTSMAGSLGLA